MNSTNCPEIFSRRSATCVLLGLPIVYFYAAVIGQVALVEGDGWAANIGLRVLVAQQIKQGILPLWNPGIFGGMPLLASIYPGVLYPPNWLFLIFSPGVAINLVVITTYHLALWGTYRYVRALALTRCAALLAAISFSFGGYLIMSIGQTSNIAAAVWLPWILLSLEKIRSCNDRRWALLGAVFIALQFFAGVPQITFYTVLVAAGYSVFSSFNLNPLIARRTWFGSLLIMVSVGVLLSAIQLLPLLELQQLSGRAALNYEQFSAYSTPPDQWLALIFPFFFGGAWQKPYYQPYWGSEGIFISCGYAGLASLYLLISLLLLRPAETQVHFWAIILVVSLFLTAGHYLPLGLNQVLFHLPIYNLFRASFRHFYEFTFAASILAAYAWNYLSNVSYSNRYRIIVRCNLLFCLLLSLTVVLYLLAEKIFNRASLTSRIRPLLAAEFWLPLLLAGLLMLLMYWVARQPASAGYAILLFTFIDLFFYGHSLLWPSYRFSVNEKLSDPASIAYLKTIEKDWHSFRLISYSTQPFGSSYDNLNYPNNSLARGLQSVNGYDMLQLKRLAEMLGDMTPDGIIHDLRTFDLFAQGLNLLNAKYALIEKGLLLLPPRWKKVAEFENVELYQNHQALPRVWLVPEARNLTSGEVLNTIKTSIFPDGTPFDPSRTALFSRAVLPALSVLPADNSIQQEIVQITGYRANHISLNVATNQARWLVLSEINYPGWQAWLDGKPIPSYRADYLLRSVSIPPGRHHVEFHYRPTSFLAGSLLSGATLALCLAYQLRKLLQQRSSPSLTTRKIEFNPTLENGL